MGRTLALAMLLLASGSLLATEPDGTPEPPAPPYVAVEPRGVPGYLLHLPEDYEQTQSAFPLLFFLHGIIQKGDGSAASLEKVANHGPFRTMRDGHWDPSLPLIVVGPQSGGIEPWWSGHQVRVVLDHVRSAYRVDRRRVYLSGISMGGRSVWWLARNFSGEFAAVVPVSGWAGDLNDTCDVFRGMGIWAFHGDRDPLIRLASGRLPIDVLSACVPPLEPAPRLTVLNDAGHGQWTRVYDNLHGDTNKGADGETHDDIYRWMLSFSR